MEITFIAFVILRANADDLAKSLANSENYDSDVNPVLLSTCALKYLHNSAPSSISEQDYQNIKYYLNLRYQKLENGPPPEIQALFQVMDLDQLEHELYLEVRYAGSRITASADAVKAFLSSREERVLDEKQVSAVLLFMIVTPDWQPYDPVNFVLALIEDQEHSLDWERVVRHFGQLDIVLSEQQFLSLYQLLLRVSKVDPQFDIQTLWRGPYESKYTHLSILSSFFACSSTDIDVLSIPAFRAVYEPLDSSDGPEGIATLAEVARRDPTISLDAVTALLDIYIPLGVDPTEQQISELSQVIGDKVGFFICSATCVAQFSIASPARLQMLRRLLRRYYLTKGRADSDYVLHTVWKHDKRPLAGALIDAHSEDPLALTAILELALEYGWLDSLLTMTTGFGFDLAALAHRSGLLDMTRWAEDKMTSEKAPFINNLSRFVLIKAQDELRISRDEQPEPHTVSLSMQAAYDMLVILEQHMEDPAELKALQRTFLQAYPRLILLCEGHTENINVDCKKSNAMPRSADAEMQELYKRMYGKELEVTKVIEYLRECKESNEPTKMDLFACMIHGLFDEYSCFSEYPVEPLKMTAVLFGGIIKVSLISDLTLRVAREMVLDALNDYASDAKMFKFGLQALSVFADRLHEPDWTDYCKSLIQIPGLRGTSSHTIAVDALIQNGIKPDANELKATDSILNGTTLNAGTYDDFDTGSVAYHFRSIDAGPEFKHNEPDEETKDKVVFFFNNVSPQNLASKFIQLRKAVHDDQHGWFADFLVNGRAKVEPNNQSLYLEMLRLFGSKPLIDEVLRSTYLVIQKLLNSDSTMQSVSERKNLKNLAVWLGSLTLAQDKPIKHKYISFIDLLLEAFQFEKLLLVIPFVCNVLLQGKSSTVFKPPNPWLLEILEVLVEFYQEVNITTNQKFDIEVLFDELRVDIKSIEASKILIERPMEFDEQTNGLLSSGLRTYDNLALGGINGNVQNPKFEAGAMHLDLPDLERLLKFPPASGSAASQTRLRQVVVEAVTHAIFEIIGSVVERSVTIATIATSNLIHKDFACEEEEDRVRQAAQRMVRELASSLALVTSKDPLKTSMMNYIRRTQAETAEQAFPEGTILMCVNDNLDIACEIVESKAADQSIPEIEAHIEREIATRAQFKAEHPNETFVGSAHNRWGSVIPEPYKQTSNGLNAEQLAIYADFGRQPRGPPSHAQTSSVDSGRQLPDVLQDSFSSMPHIPTAADSITLSHQATQPQHYQQQRGHMLPPPLPASIAQVQTNGYMDPTIIEERVGDLLNEIHRISKENDDRPFDDLHRDSSLLEMVDQVKELASSFDAVAMNCAENICKALYGEQLANRSLSEIFVHILAGLYQTYPGIAKEVAHWADMQSDSRILATDVTIELLKSGIMQLRKVDESLAVLISHRDESAVDALSTIVNEILLSDHPVAYRADFAKSLGALAQWHAEVNDMPTATDIWSRLTHTGTEQYRDGVPDERGLIRKHQINYVFSEWIKLCEQNSRNPNDKMFAAFMMQVQLKRLLHSQEDVALFLRICIDAAIATFDFAQNEERQIQRSQKEESNKPFVEVDWLARLIVCLVRSQGELNGSARDTKAGYMDMVLSLIILIMNHHQVTRGERFNQRIFFRLLSGILCDWHDFAQGLPAQNEQMLFVFAKNFLLMSPRYFPSFIYGWLGLISHRFFMPSLLKLVDDDVSIDELLAQSPANRVKGYDAFATVMESAMSYVSHLLRQKNPSPLILDIYKGLLRIILVLHHDFPEFLAETHYRLCNALPAHDTQLLNLVLSAYPSSLPELPNPFVMGLKIDRLEEIKRVPRICGDYISPLISANIKATLDVSLRSASLEPETIPHITNVLYIREEKSSSVDPQLLHSIILYIGQSAVTTAGQRGSPTFLSDSPPGSLLHSLFRDLPADARFYMICSIVNQLRWPNAHTLYFASALLHLFGTEPANQELWEPRQQIIAVLLDRIHAVLPHPWGLVVVLLELLKNPVYNFWALPFVKNSPQVSDLSQLVIEGPYSLLYLDPSPM